MSKRLIEASVVAALACLGALWFVQSRTTVLTYTAPEELLGAIVSLDGRQVGIARGQQFEFRVSKSKHWILLEKPAPEATLIEVDLSEQAFTRPPFARASSAPVTRAESDPVREIAQLQAEMVAAWNAGDLDGLIEHYLPDATILLAEQPLIQGREAITSLSRAGMAAGIKMLALEAETTWVESDLAVVRARYSSLYPHGDEARGEHGGLLAVLRRQPDGGWRVAAESWTRERWESVP